MGHVKSLEFILVLTSANGFVFHSIVILLRKTLSPRPPEKGSHFTCIVFLPFYPSANICAVGVKKK